MHLGTARLPNGLTLCFFLLSDHSVAFLLFVVFLCIVTDV